MTYYLVLFFFFFFQAEDGIRDTSVTGVQTCALPISGGIRRTERLRGLHLDSILDGVPIQLRQLLHRRPLGDRPVPAQARSEERRVGKECRSRRSPEHEKKKEKWKE